MKYVIAIAGLIVATGAMLEILGMNGQLIMCLVAAVGVVIGAPLLDQFLDAIDRRRPLTAIAAGVGTTLALAASVIVLNVVS